MPNIYSNHSADKVFSALLQHYKGQGTALRFATPFQLLCAVILSAQTNDNQVNKITKNLFAEAPDSIALAALPLARIDELIKTCGLYKNKARYLLQTARIINEQYGGEVPQTREELESLSGVGRKTAGVVLSVGFNIPALPVDTHVLRVANRLALAQSTTPDNAEKELCAQLAPELWGDMHHALIWHGRKICLGRKPQCGKCFLREDCPSAL